MIQAVMSKMLSFIQPFLSSTIETSTIIERILHCEKNHMGTVQSEEEKSLKSGTLKVWTLKSGTWKGCSKYNMSKAHQEKWETRETCHHGNRSARKELNKEREQINCME